MAIITDYRIKKIEKGPLQRFKNKNTILKKFGESGLQIYNAITGKRSVAELKKDLGLDESLFDDAINFMKDSELIELELIEQEEPEAKPSEPFNSPVPPKATVTEPAVPKKESSGKKAYAPPPEEEIKPIDLEPITPIDVDSQGISPEEEPRPTRKKNVNQSLAQEPSDESFEYESEPSSTDKEPEPISFEEPEPAQQSEIDIESPLPASAENEPAPNSSVPALSSVEKIIFDKYGDLGLRVYALVDGQRTAEEIMRQTGLSEAKLVELLDFMDEQGIIKLDYPKSPPPQSTQQPTGTRPFGSGPVNAPSPKPPQYVQPQQSYGTAPPAPSENTGFSPMIEGEGISDEIGQVPSPLELPLPAPRDIVKSVQMKAKLLLKYGDRGNKILEQVNGKNDVLDICMNMDMPLYSLYDILNFLIENGMLVLSPLQRADVRKKYGDEAYSVYKRYGKEGLLLYEIIGRNLSVNQMLEKVTRDKAKFIEMFSFIYQVLGIELPLDRVALEKQLSESPTPKRPGK